MSSNSKHGSEPARMPEVSEAVRVLLHNYEAVAEAQRDAFRWQEWLLKSTAWQLGGRAENQWRIEVNHPPWRIAGTVDTSNERNSSGADTGDSNRRPRSIQTTLHHVPGGGSPETDVARVDLVDARWDRWPKWTGTKVEVKVKVLRSAYLDWGIDLGSLKSECEALEPKGQRVVTLVREASKGSRVGEVLFWSEFVTLQLDEGDPERLATRLLKILESELPHVLRSWMPIPSKG